MDFADGGAIEIPELPMAQYPPSFAKSDAGGSKSNAQGKVKYDLLAKQEHGKDKILYSKFTDLLPSEMTNVDDPKLQWPDDDAIADTTEKTRLALEHRTQGKISAAIPMRHAEKQAICYSKRETCYSKGTIEMLRKDATVTPSSDEGCFPYKTNLLCPAAEQRKLIKYYTSSQESPPMQTVSTKRKTVQEARKQVESDDFDSSFNHFNDTPSDDVLPIQDDSPAPKKQKRNERNIADVIQKSNRNLTAEAGKKVHEDVDMDVTAGTKQKNTKAKQMNRQKPEIKLQTVQKLGPTKTKTDRKVAQSTTEPHGQSNSPTSELDECDFGNLSFDMCEKTKEQESKHSNDTLDESMLENCTDMDMRSSVSEIITRLEERGYHHP